MNFVRMGKYLINAERVACVERITIEGHECTRVHFSAETNNSVVIWDVDGAQVAYNYFVSLMPKVDTSELDTNDVILPGVVLQ